MCKTRGWLFAAIGVSILFGSIGCTPLHTLTLIAHTVPVPPWVAERMEQKFCDKERTPVMPPILPGMGPIYCMDPPTEGEIVRALPPVTRGFPFFYEEFRDDFTFVVEKLVDQIDPCTVVPLIGPAQLHHCHYKCIVYYKERIQSCYPFPFMCENDRVEVIYIDKDHFHLCVGDDPKAQREVFRDLSGP